jgi:lipoprotein-releasing system ATP-binding protein
MDIIVRNVSKDYRENNTSRVVFSNINLNISQTSSYAIVGSSGVGKTTLLHLLGGIDTPTVGSIEHFSDTSKQIRQQGRVAFIFQEHNLLPELSILENVMFPLLLRNFTWQDAYDKVKVLLAELGMSDIADDFVHQLSGGQRQRASVVRAVAQNVSFILADEPSANLDQENAQLVVDLLLRVKKEFGIGIIICSHDPLVYARMDYQIKLVNKNVIVEQSSCLKTNFGNQKD